ncbi:hypothetical protein LTR21_003942 [Exophiala xenobiotica]|nr:hypothetical protein LTR90_004924 [Exophiala xenobiotica]KAK5497967.1 hypothetical protein LTR26_001367 [Exophiala xenobiotica]KAK5516256.1 hypothetical protein LTR21_003942 [Exophiala xenobiotica]
MSLSKLSLRNTLLGLLAAVPLASAHTWIEQMMVISPNGTLAGTPGFARGNFLRSSPGFGDPTMVNLIPPDGRTINQILPSDLMCKSTQTSQTQTDGSPRLQAAPGSAVALRYQENGHVTLPDNQPGKPQNRGTVYVYGTTNPSPDDSFLAIHRVWNADGTGGDGRGVLLSTQNFDDGQCYQTNGGTISQQRQKQFGHAFDDLMGNDLWCQQDIQLPSNVTSGKPYTLYWVWDWPTMPGTAGFPDGKQEIYTTCMDVDIVEDIGVESFSQASVSYSPGQPLDNAAVSAEMTDIANPTAVTGQTISFLNAPTPSSLVVVPAPSSLVVVPTTLVRRPLTSNSTGSTIPFSASATGPAAGGASEASVAAATDTNTGVPAFLSVHTGSTAGPGIETQTFSVSPIAITDTPQAAPTGNSGGFGGNGNGRGGGGDVAVATFTEYESVTQTVLQTVYMTKYTKRDGESYPFHALPTPAPFPPQQLNQSGHGYGGGRVPRPPQPTFAPGESHSVFRWDHPRGGNHSHGPHNGTHGTHRIETHPDFWPHGFDNSATNGFSTTTMGPILTLPNGVILTMPTPGGSIMTMPDGSIMTMPVDSSGTTTTSSIDLLGTITTGVVTATVIPTANPITTTTTTTDGTGTGTGTGDTMAAFPPLSFSTLSLSSMNPSANIEQPLTVLPFPALPEPTAAPASTAHAAFKLRARNPFVWIWGDAEAEATPTPSS